MTKSLLLSLAAAAVAFSTAAETFESGGLWYSTGEARLVNIVAPPSGTTYSGAVTIVPEVTHSGTKYTLANVTNTAFQGSGITSLTVAKGLGTDQVPTIWLKDCASLSRINVGSYYEARLDRGTRYINVSDQTGVIDAYVRERDGSAEVIVKRFEVYDINGAKLTPMMQNYDGSKRFVPDAEGVIKLGLPLSDFSLGELGLLNLLGGYSVLTLVALNPAGDGAISFRVEPSTVKTGQYVEAGGLRYTISDGKAYVYKPAEGKTYSGDIVLPQTVADAAGTYPVYGISTGAFAGTDITSIKFNAGMTEIHASPFKNCPKLVSADLSECRELNVTSGSIFYSCPSLRSIDCSNMQICNGSFAYDCQALQSVTLGSGGDMAMISEDCRALYVVELLDATDSEVRLRVTPGAGGGVCTASGTTLPYWVYAAGTERPLIPEVDGTVTLSRDDFKTVNSATGTSRFNGNIYIGYDSLHDSYLQRCTYFDRVTITEDQLAGISAATPDAADAPAEYFDLQGRRVSSPAAPGIYIRRQGADAVKTIIR
ncbi:MAG: leucine-rich repeat domain-containing protein [Bacteroides sp.]|nr:leucine-rich repeat domain-containing protein [Bacteroides sp.]MCM1095837.1 leucine-rich repeat domain-containing protein [Terasakiella sp.]